MVVWGIGNIKRLLRWVVRFRKRKGYGVHSPFAFNLIRGVIYENGIFYAYKDLEYTFRQNKKKGVKQWRLKDYKLLFRLANFQQARVGWTIGRRDDQMFIKALSKGCQHTLYEVKSSCCDASKDKADLIILAEEWSDDVLNYLKRLNIGGMLIVKNVGDKHKKVWQLLLQQPQAQVSFNLYDFGIILFKPELQRQHYVVNYL